VPNKWEKVLEVIALEGYASGYWLSKQIGVSVSNAQWWLTHLQDMGLVTVYRKEPTRRQRILYGLTIIGLLIALRRAKVRNNFADVFEKFIKYQDTQTKDRKQREAELELKKNLLEALWSPEVSNNFRELYLTISNALDELTDVYHMDDQTLFNLATYLADIRQPEKMGRILGTLYPKVLLIQRYVEAYRFYASNLDKIITGEMQ
jgi:DNA-binding MarR family transcriptional regulator